MSSAFHNQALELLKEIYPTVQIEEEKPIKVGNKTYYLDIYVPLLKLGVEIHGSQHYQFNPLFHASKADFFAQQKRDREKAEKLEEMGITLIELPYNETDKWEQLLRIC